MKDDLIKHLEESRDENTYENGLIDVELSREDIKVILRGMKGENILDTIKCELLDTRTRLDMKLKGELMNIITKEDLKRVVRRIKRLDMIIKSLDLLNSIPLE